jgi:tRNA A37 threonylcarbamoyladenosine dehydratase
MLQDKVDLLKDKTVAIFGVGGVGGYTLEALIRSGIDNIDIYDFDTIDISNINRQVIAVSETVGKSKVDEWVKRAKLINPKININGINMFVDSDSIESIDFSKYNYVVDAIDTVTSKMLLIKKCNELNIPIISSMGTGNKLHPEMLEITDIKKTTVCPLARVIRKKCKEEHIKSLTVIYSKEEPKKTNTHKPGSTIFVPSVAGIMIAGWIFRQIVGE